MSIVRPAATKRGQSIKCIILLKQACAVGTAILSAANSGVTSFECEGKGPKPRGDTDPGKIERYGT
jgi:hypothetical protein